eukprot:SAG22_NODE_9853_length_566_cov_0.884368_1_plen_88_part_10
MCQRWNASTPDRGRRGSGGGASVIIEGSLLAGHFFTDVWLEEVPAQLVLRNNWVQNSVVPPMYPDSKTVCSPLHFNTTVCGYYLVKVT